MDRLADVVGQLRGSDLERRYRERAHAYFNDLLADIHVSPPQELAAVVNRALAAGVLSRQERKDMLDADIIVRGRRWEDQAEAYLAVGVSAVVDEGDVERAIRRAGLLSRVTGTPAVPVVAGQAITPEAEQLARSLRAWRVLNGRVISPQNLQMGLKVAGVEPGECGYSLPLCERANAVTSSREGIDGCAPTRVTDSLTKVGGGDQGTL